MGLDEITKVQQYDNMCDKETKTYQYTITVNEFRKNPTYAIHFNWFRFMSIGVVPFILLVYLNAQGYSDLQKRQTNKRIKKYSSEKTEKHATKANHNVQEKHKANNDLKQATSKGIDSGASKERNTLITTAAHINFTSTQTDAKHTNTENGERL